MEEEAGSVEDRMVIQPGRKLDAEIAKKVFKFFTVFDTKLDDFHLVRQDNSKRNPLPNYSTNTDAAYKVVNHYQNIGLYCNVGSTIKDGENYWRAVFYKNKNAQLQQAVGETLAHAICLAALDVIEDRNQLEFVPEKKKGNVIYLKPGGKDKDDDFEV